MSNCAIFVKVFKGERLIGGKKESSQDDSIMTMWTGEIKELRNGHYLFNQKIFVGLSTVLGTRELKIVRKIVPVLKAPRTVNRR